MPTARYGLGLASANGKLYAIGGLIGLASLQTNEEFNPATDTWTNKPNMPTARSGVAATFVNTAIYVTGGYVPSGAQKTTNEAYGVFGSLFVPFSDR